MAAIYDYETGNELMAGLQGCKVCDEALQAAQRMAEQKGEPVLLHDDDGEWIIGAKDAIAYKYNDPTEGARWIYDEGDLADIRREDPSLIVEMGEAE